MFKCVLNMYQFQVKGYHKKYGHERRIWYDDKRRPPTLSELTTIIIDMEITHFGSEVSTSKMC